MLKVLTIVMGVLVIVSRLCGILFPGSFKKMLKLFLEEKGVLLYMMVIGAVLGALFIYAFRYDRMTATAGWQAYIMLIFGIIMAALALLSLAVPRMLLDIMGKFTDVSEATMRLLCLVGVVAGVLILLLGLSM